MKDNYLSLGVVFMSFVNTTAHNRNNNTTTATTKTTVTKTQIKKASKINTPQEKEQTTASENASEPGPGGTSFVALEVPDDLSEPHLKIQWSHGGYATVGYYCGRLTRWYVTVLFITPPPHFHHPSATLLHPLV